jgi:hypothetical protein
MIGRPAIVMHENALRSLFSCRKNERERLIRGIELLADAPCDQMEFTQRGPDGRQWMGLRVAKHLVYYWFDSPVNELRIMKLEPLYR